MTSYKLVLMHLSIVRHPLMPKEGASLLRHDLDFGSEGVRVQLWCVRKQLEGCVFIGGQCLSLRR